MARQYGSNLWWFLLFWALRSHIVEKALSCEVFIDCVVNSSTAGQLSSQITYFFCVSNWLVFLINDTRVLFVFKNLFLMCFWHKQASATFVQNLPYLIAKYLSSLAFFIVNLETFLQQNYFNEIFHFCYFKHAVLQFF